MFKRMMSIFVAVAMIATLCGCLKAGETSKESKASISTQKSENKKSSIFDDEESKDSKSKSSTKKSNTKNKLDGHAWEMRDGSLMELEKDGTFKWYKEKADKKDNYYTGTYSSIFGNEAIAKIDEEFGFDEEELSKNTKISKSDVYYLEITNKEMITGGKDQLNGKEKVSKYYIVFYENSTNEAFGMNLGTQNEVGMKRCD